MIVNVRILREGDYLALTIENLSERRPSLVLGDVQKYNGRLPFGILFSRFGFANNIAPSSELSDIWAKSFFPSNIQLRSKPQLDVQLNKDYDIVFKNTKFQWQTITLVETILQLVKHLPNSRLLVGTPSNSSADLITTRLLDSGDLCPGDFIRLVSQNQIEKELIPEHLLPYCATIDISADGTSNDDMIITESGLKLKCQMKYLGRHRVTISTCSTLGNFLQMDFAKGHFTHALIDESGQCTEPEIMITITQVSRYRGQVILAGDPNQLQAVVTNRYAAENGYDLSFLERILARSPYLRTSLDIRSHVVLILA
ncbi:Probable RNA helicase armi [Eumeta japonica]|uniref:Probable RNA helicase armi n=1 Tax=Eumeta variegata TaxID=151549 RepID=A0A4C1T744_EUMVA|nr:Probable RNA helicase armi [Eumeta japonica]